MNGINDVFGKIMFVILVGITVFALITYVGPSFESILLWFLRPLWEAIKFALIVVFLVIIALIIVLWAMRGGE